MTNSADSDQLAPSEASWSGSALFAKTRLVVFTKRMVKRDPKSVVSKQKCIEKWPFMVIFLYKLYMSKQKCIIFSSNLRCPCNKLDAPHLNIDSDKGPGLQ